MCAHGEAVCNNISTCENENLFSSQHSAHFIELLFIMTLLIIIAIQIVPFYKIMTMKQFESACISPIFC